jgi:hypothetical protein
MVDLARSGVKVRRIAQVVWVSSSGISKVLKSHRETGNVAPMASSERRRLTSTRDDRMLLRKTPTERRTSVRALRQTRRCRHLNWQISRQNCQSSPNFHWL